MKLEEVATRDPHVKSLLTVDPESVYDSKQERNAFQARWLRDEDGLSVFEIGRPQRKPTCRARWKHLRGPRAV